MRFSSLSASLVMVALAGCPGPPRPSTLDSSVTPADTTTPTDTPVATDVPVTDVADVPRDVSDAGDVAALDASDATPADSASDAVSDAVTDVLSDATVDVADVLTDSGSDAGIDAVTDVALVDRPTSDVEDAGPWSPIGDGTCRARARGVPTQAGLHVDPDAGPITWLTNPPSSGPHFNEWARWGAWPTLARGNWVHNLEHGGVVMLYQCPTGTCDSTRDALVAAMNAIPTDPACMPDDAAPARVRVVITRDNEITTPIAAVAWGFMYEADCVDANSLRLFYTMYAGHAPEDFCADGFVP